VFDNNGKEVPPGGGGYLVIRKPWPAMLRGIYGDPKRYEETYWSRWKDTYFVGDGARIDEDGLEVVDFRPVLRSITKWIKTRAVDVQNVNVRYEYDEALDAFTVWGTVEWCELS